MENFLQLMAGANETQGGWSWMHGLRSAMKSKVGNFSGKARKQHCLNIKRNMEYCSRFQ